MLVLMRIAITSPERLFLDALTCLLAETRFNVVAAGTDSRECIVAARLEQADLLLVDLHGVSDQDLQFLLGAQAFGDFQTILILDSKQNIPEGFELGIVRTDPSSVLIEMAQGMAVNLVRPAAPRGRGRPRIITHGLELSNREYEVATLIARGYTNQKIAETMQLKEQSVKNLVSTVIRKLRCENRVQVALQLNKTSPG